MKYLNMFGRLIFVLCVWPAVLYTDGRKNFLGGAYLFIRYGDEK